MTIPRILVFAGSLRTASLNKKLAGLAAEAVRAAGGEATFLDLRDYPMPLYDGDIEAADGVPENARKLKAMFKAHQGLIIACPEYNGAITAVLKNTLDWISRQDGGESGAVPYEGKIAALCGATPGQFATLRSMDMVRHVLMQLGTTVLARRVGVPRAHEAFDDNGQLKDPKLAGALQGLAAEVVRVTGRLAP